MLNKNSWRYHTIGAIISIIASKGYDTGSKSANWI